MCVLIIHRFYTLRKMYIIIFDIGNIPSPVALGLSLIGDWLATSYYGINNLSESRI